MMKKRAAKGASRPAEPDWVLLNEKAVTVGFDFTRMVEEDKLGLKGQAPQRGKLLELYSSAISEAVASALQALYPSTPLRRSVVAGSSDVKNIASCGAVSIFMEFGYADPKNPTLNVKVLAEEKEQPRVVKEIERIKREMNG